MAVLGNPRHERFAMALSEGKTADQAYSDAGYSPNRGNAVRLKANENVSSRVAELLALGAEEGAVTLSSLRRELDEDRAGARGANQWSAAISAVMAKAKLFGFLREEGGGGTVNIQINLTPADKRLL
jgi:hypothetical protein